ncbi:MAG: 2-C-methyl-D-erythritol 4-phosphate cytidylyltransferase [Chlorobi bacterium]|nr:2-C-methyl-D-erythritol 4-phosphate cytidylyltransferase [Chlorobiota bacterium]
MSENPDFTACIPAAGQGRRVGASMPKQYVLLRGIPLIVHTLKKFDRISSCQEIIIATDDRPRLREILADYSWTREMTLVAGGATRAESVVNMLTVVRPGSLVLVHDAARPCIRGDDIKHVARVAAVHGAAVLAIPARDTLKKVDEEGHLVTTLDRRDIWQAQTPQAAYVDDLLPAYRAALQRGLNVTDDVQVLEGGSIAVQVVPGSWLNIKITSTEDISFAETILSMEPDE